MIKLDVGVPGRGCFVLAAVSGGADSVALLHLLAELARRDEIRLHAAHFEHGIRGPASLEDAALVRRLCADWRVPLHEGAADVPALAKARGVGLEQAARDARYAFLRRTQEEIGVDYIALAHHLDDQAETVLMHLLRGSGLRGAVGMRERDNGLWRPLLAVRKAELVDYLRERGIPWREDATNAQADTPRNLIRIEAMPALERAYPGAAQALGRFARLAAAEDDYMAAQTRAFLRAHAEKVPPGWRLACVPDAPAAVVRRAVHALSGLDAEACLRAEALYRAEKGRAALSGPLTLERTGNSLYFIAGAPAAAAAPLPGEGLAALPGVGEVRASRAAPEPLDTPLCQVLDADSLAGACLRTRRPGDFIRPLGLGGRQKLSDYLINHRIDRPMRDAVLLVARGSEVLWAAGVGISETAKLRPLSRGVRLEAREYRRSWGDHEDA